MRGRHRSLIVGRLGELSQPPERKKKKEIDSAGGRTTFEWQKLDHRVGDGIPAQDMGAFPALLTKNVPGGGEPMQGIFSSDEG